jgi:hypothetical protein
MAPVYSADTYVDADDLCTSFQQTSSIKDQLTSKELEELFCEEVEHCS